MRRMRQKPSYSRLIPDLFLATRRGHIIPNQHDKLTHIFCNLRQDIQCLIVLHRCENQVIFVICIEFFDCFHRVFCCMQLTVMADNQTVYIIRFPFIENDYYYNILLSFGDKCECLEPLHVRTEMRRRIHNIAALYEK